MKNVIMLGFMGTGKSTVSKVIAERLGFKFVEMDEMIEAREGMTINEIFKTKGEGYFRNLEQDLVLELSQKGKQVISTGGGVVLNEQNINNFKEQGVLISLTATAEVIYTRVKNETQRPLLKTENPLKTIHDMLEYRMPFYEKADHLLDTSGLTIDKVVEEVFKILKSYRGKG
ncbi:shikimate kinase [Candidatus Auribacterota bacterium]